MLRNPDLEATDAAGSSGGSAVTVPIATRKPGPARSSKPQAERRAIRLQTAVAQARQQLSALQEELAGILDSAKGTVEEEDCPGGTTTFERAQLETLIEVTHKKLDELAAADERIRSGTYGVCEQCNRAIAPERLVARPTARTCIQCARRS